MLRVSSRLFSPSYRLNQRLSKDLMKCELEAIEEVVRDSKVSNVSMESAPELIAQKTLGKARRMMGISKKGIVNKDKVQKYFVETPKSRTEDSLEESLSESSNQSPGEPDRLSMYESMKGSPKYQDLTHPEARRVQELFERKKMLARKIQWLKNNQIIDPVKSVNKEMKKKEREERFSPIVKSEEFDPVMERRIKKLEFKMERDTAIYRIRTELRQQKLEKSAVMNMTTPNVGSVITDPLKRHLQRRTVRVALLMQQYLEELFTCNSAQIIIDHLGGAAISVERVVAHSTRGVHDVYVRITSDHDREWVRKQLEVLAPKIRSQIATRVNYGYTPEFKFHVLDTIDKFSKSRLMKLAGDAKREVDASLHRHFMKEMNWK
jgi:ribosome-binding factor A